MDPMIADVTVIIPHIPVRPKFLERAVLSVRNQTVRPKYAMVENDENREGSSVMRNRAIARVETEWIAFLDDDDEFLPHHIETLTEYAKRWPDVDVFYPGCRVFDGKGREVPRLMEWGRYLQKFDADLLRERSYIPVTSMVRTSLAKQAKFEAPEGSVYDDWGFYLQMLDLGAKFMHVPVITWHWFHHGGNTQGLMTKW